MSKVLFLESVAGVAGDMFAASFVDAGLVTREELEHIPTLLGLDDVQVEITQVVKATMRATHINVGWKSEKWKKAFGGTHTHGAHTHSHSNVATQSANADSHWHTHYLELDRFLETSKLDSATKAFARKVFHLIAVAEADAHGMKIEEIAFHEVGAVDSIVDVAMAAFCVSKVSPSKILATPIKLGRGLIKIEHGTHPVPPPASIRLVTGLPTAEVPDGITRANVELSTPTGIAILKALEPKFVTGVCAGTIRAQGMGAGTMDLGQYPNVFRVLLIDESAAQIDLPYLADQVTEVCCNMDDETAERTAWVMENLMTMGALDVWVTPTTGKKGRAAVLLSVLCAGGSHQKFADWLLRHSSTFGIRYNTWDRLKLDRKFETRKMGEAEVKFKIGMTTTGEVLKEKAEFEDVRKVWDKDAGFKS